MNKNPLVSYLMTVYNSENIIERALQSIAAQTYTNIEVVIVIEYECTDKTVELCQQFCKNFSNVILIYNQKKLGVAESLNVGLDYCRGELIARMDADDFSYPSRIERQVNYLIDNPHIDLLGTNARILKNKIDNECVLEEHWYKEVPTEEEILCRLLFGTCFCHPTIMFRSKIVKKLGYKYPVCLAEDYAFLAELMGSVKMSVLPEVLLDYYVDGNNLSFSNYSMVRLDSMRISKQTIFRELQIDTQEYNDSLFGWRYYDVIPENIKEFLFQSYQLLKEIESRNNVLQKYSNHSLSKVLSDEWELTKWLIRPYANVKCLEKDFNHIDLDELNAAYSNADSVIFYGTGSYCEMVLSQHVETLDTQIIAFCDSDVRKHGTIFMGKPVIAPEQICNFNIDTIVISSPKYYVEIKEFLNNSRLLKDKIGVIDIISFFQTRPYRQYLKKMLKICADSQKIYLFCGPDYSNIGDHAIAYAENQFIFKYCGIQPIEITYNEYRQFITPIKNHIRSNDLILITGGGFMGSAWFHLEKQTREVVSSFPKNPIIIMPQTFYWDRDNAWQCEMERSRLIYEQHPNLTMCARDKKSHTIIQSVYKKCNVILVPDMVLSCEWTNMINKESVRNGALLCFKDDSDKESVLGQFDKLHISKVTQKRFHSVICCNTNLDYDVSIVEREREIKNVLKEFCNAKIVITDRLHGMLFSLITATPCIVFNNFNHKLISNYEWIHHISFIKFAKKVDEIDKLVTELENIKAIEFDSSDYSKHFSALTKLLFEKLKEKS